MRSGLSSYIDKPKYDVLGEDTRCRQLITNLVKNIVNKGKWFACCSRISDQQVDIMSLSSNGRTLGNILAEDYSESVYRTAIYKYLLRDFLCYYEAPTYIKASYYNDNSGGGREAYNKYIVTSNIRVVAAWLGISVEEAEKAYGSRLMGIDHDFDTDTFPYVKLYVDKSGNNKVTKPKSDLDLTTKGIRIVPVFALKAGIDVLWSMCDSNYYNITFIKDNGSERTINITSNLSLLRKIYTKNDSLLVSEFEKQYKGDYLNNHNLSRGYIRVIEVGTCLDGGATRSINVARIVKIEKCEPDLTYIDIDLSIVMDTFINAISVLKTATIADVVDALNMFNVGNKREYAGKPITTSQELEAWAKTNEIVLSTPFIKQLAVFMLGNPLWFNFTGKKKVYGADTSGSGSSTPTNSSVNDTISDDDFELDLSF